MDQQKTAAKSKNKILKFLPRATSSISFQNPPIFSPAKDMRSSEKTHKSNLRTGFSGPMLSMIPAKTRRKIKNDSTFTILYEPTSPRVSCMGQVKYKHQKNKLSGTAAGPNKPLIIVKPTKKVSRTISFPAVKTYNGEDDCKKASENSKKKSGLKKIFGKGSGAGAGEKPKTPEKAPSLGTMKRFSSGRDALSNFDWTTQVASAESGDRSYYSGDERGDDQEGEVMIPLSAPIVMRNKEISNDKFVRVGVNLEPRKEINLWKRRTIAQPIPLQLHVNSLV